MSYSGTLFPVFFSTPTRAANADDAQLMCVLWSADKDQSHVIGGLKAAISNPNTSTEAKEHAAERLGALGEPGYSSPPRETAHHELGTHQIAGYKATINSSWALSKSRFSSAEASVFVYRPSHFGEGEGTRS
jgi:hypothetical protein